MVTCPSQGTQADLISPGVSERASLPWMLRLGRVDLALEAASREQEAPWCGGEPNLDRARSGCLGRTPRFLALSKEGCWSGTPAPLCHNGPPQSRSMGLSVILEEPAPL